MREGLKRSKEYYDDLYEDPKNRDLGRSDFTRGRLRRKKGVWTKLDLLHQAAKETWKQPRLKGISSEAAEINLMNLGLSCYLLLGL